MKLPPFATSPPHLGQGSADPGALEGLAAYLRDHPETDKDDVPTLAERFGVPTPFLTSVVEGLRVPPPARPWYEVALVGAWSWLSEVGARLANWARSITDRPLVFVAWTGVLFVLLSVVIESLPLPFRLDSTLVTGSLLVVCLGMHLACYARFGIVRYPAYGAVMAFVALLLGQVATLSVADPRQRVVLALVVSALLAFVYGGLGAAAAVIGAWGRVRRARRARFAQSRQEMLDRLFELKERLRSLPEGSTALDPPPGRLVVWASRPDYPLLAFAVGFGAGFVRVVAVALGRLADPTLGSVTLLTLFFNLGGGVLGLALFAFATGLARSARAAVVAALCVFAGLTLATGLPLGPFGPGYLVRSVSSPGMILGAALVAGFGLVVGLATALQRHTEREGLLRGDDPAAMLAERVLLERRLQSAGGETCVMSVDVAKSTKMKEGADPLIVEWTFREYQRLVARATEAEGGDVLSTTGDGAVCSFNHPASALAAARRLHSELPRFNQRVNRLKDPFRLRVGLHSDQVQAALGDVQFTHAIDVAAHVQKHAPVGGILVTEAVASRLPEEGLAALRETVEGCNVFLVVNPTLGA